jgi:CheY-like chemotaxis protein
MNAILGFAQLMQNDPNEPLSPSQRDSVQHILKSGWHLLELINDVLDYSRIESGRLQLKMDNIEIAPVVRECLEMIEPLARERGVRLRDEVTPCMPHWVRADRLRLRQILLNLMSNAVKYNKEDGEVVLACTSNEAWVRINVADNGRGIAPQRIEEMFEPFNRLDADAHLIPGTGIGLAISKQLVELMGGQMGVESKMGQGSNFWLDMPVASPASVEQETPVAEQLPKQRRQTRMPADCCVLYIEDNPANVLLMEKIFAQHYPQIRLETAGNAEMGLIMAYNLRPALILLDIGLPGMSGHQVIETLHANEVMRDIPVVAVSAYTSRSEVRRGMAEGFFEYITKPIDVEHFIRVIDAALQKQQPSS